MATVSFIDLAGDRHQLELSAEQQAALTRSGSQSQQQALLEGWGLLATEPDPAADVAPEQPSATTDGGGAAEAALALATMQARIDAIQQQVASYASAGELGQLQEQLAAWSAQAGRVSLAHAELSALTDQTVAQCTAVSDAAQQRLQALAEEQSTALAAVAEALTTTRSEVAAAVSSADRRVAALERQVATDPVFRGPQGTQGEQGLAGSGVAYADIDPTTAEPASFGQRFYGRSLVPGDLAFWRTPDSLRVFRTADGRTFRQIDEVLNRIDVRDLRASVLSTGNTVFPPATINPGSGGGTEPMLVRSIAGAVGATETISSADRWAVALSALSLPAPTSCELQLELTAIDGPMVGNKLFLSASLLYDAAAAIPASVTIFSELGELSLPVKADVELVLEPVTAPAGIGIAIPAGLMAPQLHLSIAANTSGSTGFLVSGAVQWLNVKEAVPSVSGGSLLPAWTL